MAFVNSWKPEINFKRVPRGWVFRGPNPWILGDPPHNLVNDEQKVRIATVLRTMGAVLPLAAITASIIVVSLAVFWKVGDIGQVFLIVVLALVAISAVAAIQRMNLKRILAEAALTNERITYAEMRKADEDSASPEEVRWRWLGSVLMCVLWAVLIILNWTEPARPARAILFAPLCLYAGWQAVRWYRVSKRRAKQEG